MVAASRRWATEGGDRRRGSDRMLCGGGGERPGGETAVSFKVSDKRSVSEPTPKPYTLYPIPHTLHPETCRARFFFVHPYPSYCPGPFLFRQPLEAASSTLCLGVAWGVMTSHPCRNSCSIAWRGAQVIKPKPYPSSQPEILDHYLSPPEHTEIWDVRFSV